MGEKANINGVTVNKNVMKQEEKNQVLLKVLKVI